MALLALILTAALVSSVAGHGFVLDPPSRASAWRQGFPTPRDYDDDGVNCGGLTHQHTVNKGRCGICGDAYDLRTPRPHELGGAFGQGIIVAHYEPNSVIPVTVVLTSSHQGYWELKLCPDPTDNSQACFDKHPLTLDSGEQKYYPKASRSYKLRYILPKNVVCEHCVIQWKYIAGNNWGVCANGTQGLGCGSQEQFGACSDVSIGLGLYRSESRRQPVKTETDYSGLSEGLQQLLKQNALAAKIATKQRLKNKHKKQRINSKKVGKKKSHQQKNKNKKYKSIFDEDDDFDWDFDNFLASFPRIEDF